MRRPAFFLAFDATRWHVARITGDTVDVIDVPASSEGGRESVRESERESVRALERESERAKEPESGSSHSHAPTVSRSHAPTLSRSHAPTPSRSHAPTLPLSHAPVPAQELAARLREWHYRGQRVCLGIPSDRVFAAQVDATKLPRRNRRAAVLFRLEEQLPVDAERLTADFLPAVDGHALGVAVETDRFRAILDLLAAAGIEVGVVSPTALLALSEICRGKPPDADYVLIAPGGDAGEGDEGRGAGGGGGRESVRALERESEEAKEPESDPSRSHAPTLSRPHAPTAPAPGLDLFRLAAGQPIGWITAYADDGDLVRSLQADLLLRPVAGEPARVRVLGALPPPLAEGLQRDAAVVLLLAGPEPPLVAAARAAGRILANEESPWVDLRRDGLAPADAAGRLPGIVRAAALLSALLVLTVAAVFVWRGTRYDALARRYQAEQAAEFRRLYPNAAVPANIRSRLRSELARLAGLSGAGQELPLEASALDTLRQVVASFPASIRVRITELRVNPSDVLIEGQTRTHTDAEAIAQAVARAGLRVEPPRTETLAKGGVAFSLAGKLPSLPKSGDPK